MLWLISVMGTHRDKNGVMIIYMCVWYLLEYSGGWEPWSVSATLVEKEDASKQKMSEDIRMWGRRIKKTLTKMESWRDDRACQDSPNPRFDHILDSKVTIRFSVFTTPGKMKLPVRWTFLSVGYFAPCLLNASRNNDEFIWMWTNIMSEYAACVVS